MSIEEDFLAFLIKNTPDIIKSFTTKSNDELDLQKNSTVTLKYEDLRKKNLQFVIICDGNGNFHFLDVFKTQNLIELIVISSINKKITVEEATKLIEILSKYRSHFKFD